MAKPKAKVYKPSARELMNELKEEFLRDGSGLELVEKGLYHKAMASIYHFGGSVDKNTEILSRIRKLIEDLDEAI